MAIVFRFPYLCCWLPLVLKINKNKLIAIKHHNMHSCPNLLSDRSFLEEKLSALKSSNSSVVQAAAHEYCKALDAYLELPSLLDPIVPHHIATLSNLIYARLSQSSNLTPTSLVSVLSHSLYTLIKVRGPKRVTVHFPHQVHHLRQLLPTLSAIEALPESSHLWQLRYVLYTWLSVAIRVPFPLQTILTIESLTRAISHAQAALLYTGPVAQAATTFLAHFLSRRDAVHHRTTLIQHFVAKSLIPNIDSVTRTAALALLASLFKHGHRDDLQPHVHRILQALSQPNITPTTTEAHLVTKLSHRLALSFLPPRPAAWRYTRTLPTIRPNRGHTGFVEPETQTSLSSVDAGALETVLDLLLTGLRKPDTVVRWSAAKGIARITSRLPRELAMDVIDAVLSVFHDVQQARSDAAWHGACLAIAELARRGLLLPTDQHFRDAFDAIHRAAAFDVRRGAISVGAHVRDAACYAIWAVARAYEKKDVAPFASVITEAMLPLALLDREVNCRRAAAAALQECVGRLSPALFVDGIKLITLAEYFALGDRTAAYLTIAPQVAQIGEGIHFDAIVKELWHRKLVHWDPVVRGLAAKALARFVNVDNDGTIAHQVLPALVSRATRKGDVVNRHGAVLGIAELVKVVGYKKLQSLGREIRHIPKLLHEHNVMTGRTGDDMRIACCHLIQNLAVGAEELYLDLECGQVAAEEALLFLETILGCGKEHLYGPATAAYAAVCEHVIASDEEWHVKITRRILDGISESSFFEYQRGFALAAGACGESIISDQVTAVLCRESVVNNDVEVRRNCVTSLGKAGVRTVEGRIVDLLDGFARAMEDYATDDRGDVGSWVREASMKSASKVICSVYGKNTSGGTQLVEEQSEGALMVLLNRIIEQCCSKIDRTRGVAGETLKDICMVVRASGVHTKQVSGLCEKLCQIFGFAASNCEESGGEFQNGVTFSESAQAFPAMRKALVIPEIARSVMRGLISAGGGMGQQASYACDSLVCHLSEKSGISLNEEAELGEIIHIVESREERLVIPALKILDYMLKTEVLRKLEDEDLKRVARTVRSSWRQGLRNVKLTSAAVGVVCEVGSLSGSALCFEFKEGSAGRECLEALMIVLGGPLPRLRRMAAENLYMLLLEVDEVDEVEGSAAEATKASVAMKILVDTSWHGADVANARRKRNELCNVLGIRQPRPIALKS